MPASPNTTSSPPRAPRLVTTIIGIFCVIGGALLVAALVLAAHEWRFLESSERAVATVSRIDAGWMSGSSGRYGGRGTGGNTGYRVVATFRAANGRQIEVASPSQTSWTGYRVGDTIAVDYPAGRPDQAQLARFVDRWMLALVLGAIGAAALAMCGLAIWLLRRPGTQILSNGYGGFEIRSASTTIGTAPPPAPAFDQQRLRSGRRGDEE